MDIITGLPPEILDMVVDYLIPHHWNERKNDYDFLRLRLVCSKNVSYLRNNSVATRSQF